MSLTNPDLRPHLESADASLAHLVKLAQGPLRSILNSDALAREQASVRAALATCRELEGARV